MRRFSSVLVLFLVVFHVECWSLLPKVCTSGSRSHRLTTDGPEAWSIGHSAIADWEAKNPDLGSRWLLPTLPLSRLASGGLDG